MPPPVELQMAKRIDERLKREATAVRLVRPG
jgi:hypothetical protein